MKKIYRNKLGKVCLSPRESKHNWSPISVFFFPKLLLYYLIERRILRGAPVFGRTVIGLYGISRRWIAVQHSLVNRPRFNGKKRRLNHCSLVVVRANIVLLKPVDNRGAARRNSGLEQFESVAHRISRNEWQCGDPTHWAQDIGILRFVPINCA